MSILSKVKQNWLQSGPRGVLAGALRYAASRINGNSLQNEKSPTDEFLSWVRFAVPGMVTQGNVEAMRFAVANMPSEGSMLEIGSFCGLSTVLLSYWLDKYSSGNTLFTCDKWEFERQQLGTPLGDSPSVTHDAYREYVRETYLRVMRTFAVNRLPYTVECISDDFFRLWRKNERTVDVFGRKVTLGGKLSFCYIDGNHTYDYARRDFENTDRHLLPGGFIFFDDSADGSHWEVNRLVRKIAAESRYELVLRNPNYLFKKKGS
jgi:hypothetical protein